MTKVLVTGANGFVGSYVCRELINAGYEVRALVRENSNRDAIKDLKLEYAIGDITDKNSLIAAMQGVEGVFNIAGLFRQAKFPDEVYMHVNRDGIRNVFEAAIECGVKRVVHCSTNGVHSHVENPPADENVPYSPGDIYQVSKCEGEKVALEFMKSGKIEGVVIRPAMIWGPGDRRTLKIFKGIAHHTLPMVGNGKTLYHWLMVTDLARAFRLAYEVPEANGEIYLIAGESDVTMTKMYQTIAKEAGTWVWPIKLPALPLLWLGSLVEAVCKPFGIEPPIHRRRMNFFVKTRSFNCTKAKTQLGYKAEHTFEEEVHIIYTWYKEHGWL